MYIWFDKKATSRVLDDQIVGHPENADTMMLGYFYWDGYPVDILEREAQDWHK